MHLDSEDSTCRRDRDDVQPSESVPFEPFSDPCVYVDRARRFIPLRILELRALQIQLGPLERRLVDAPAVVRRAIGA